MSKIKDRADGKGKEIENYGPWHSSYLAIYFVLTGLHALHVIGGAVVIFALWGPLASVWKTDPERYTTGWRFPAFSGTLLTWFGFSCSRSFTSYRIYMDKHTLEPAGTAGRFRREARKHMAPTPSSAWRSWLAPP